jgi:hypothetical protein
MEALFINGVPVKLTVHDFRRHHLQSFPALVSGEYDSIVADSIDAVYSMFSGVAKMWDWHPRQVWFDKTVLCYRYLTAWYLTDHYSDLAAGDSSGFPLKRKKVDGVDLTLDTDAVNSNAGRTVHDPLAALRSNRFGRMALMMIQSSAKRALLRNCRFV